MKPLQRLMCILDYVLLFALPKTYKYGGLLQRNHISTMDGISTTPIENSVQFLRLRDKYKSDLLEDPCSSSNTISTHGKTVSPDSLHQ